MKVRILDCMRAELEESKALQAEYQEGMELASLLKKLYAEYNVPAYMQDCTYLYQQRWVFYIGDVLRIRRDMYGQNAAQGGEEGGQHAAGGAGHPAAKAWSFQGVSTRTPGDE